MVRLPDHIRQGILDVVDTEEAISSVNGQPYQRRLGPRNAATGEAPRRQKGRRGQDLSPTEFAEANQRRNPSQQLVIPAMCPAAISRNHPEKGTCKNKAGWGTDHPGIDYCKMHGGNTTSGKKSAARSFGRGLIEKQKFGGDLTLVNITPEQAIIEEVRRSTAMVRWLEERIGQWTIQDDQVSLGGLPRLMDETFKGTATFTDQREWLILYRDERAHMVKVAKMAIDAGLAKRMVEVAEDQGRMLAVAIKQVLDALELTPTQASLVPRVVPGVLRAIGQSSAPKVPDISSLASAPNPSS